ncbi:MAG TPA: TonB-dependent receptor [Candidatus Baltobacteraceae bacterium]|nr:TonB-dependent receptor [Candidatus Baltobacteraceae bacterium]
MRRLIAAFAAFAFVFVPTLHVVAGTTGSFHGRVVEAGTGAPVAGATITAVSPSQSATVSTDAGGNFSIISLAPDTYVVSASKSGYDPQSQPGMTVFADQSRTIDFSLPKALKTIARTQARSSQSLVHAGVTSDLYSVGPSGQKAAQALGGAGSMSQAYGAIASAPGVNMPSTQQGWYQGVYIRGGDIDQVAYEFDGLPVTRQSDLAPITTLTSLGSQEVQVYTGGTAASSNSSGLAGYINQVIKTGTSPGYANAELGIGTPAFFHSAKVEVSGATPDRLFSYYAGFAGTNETFRYGDQFNAAGNPLYFYPLLTPSGNPQFNAYGSGILDGNYGKAPNYGAAFAPGPSYSQAVTYDRENLVNVHIGIPHKNSAMRDDIQLLYIGGGIFSGYYSSQNELGITPHVASGLGFGYPIPYLKSTYYGGSLMQTPDASKLIYNANFPSQPDNETLIDPGQRDGSSTFYSIQKFQYQKNFDPASYLRFLAYTEYSNWFFTGLLSAQLPFGGEPADYEVDDHTLGAGLVYSNQLSAKHLLTAQMTFNTQNLQTYNAQFSSTDSATTSLGGNNYLYSPCVTVQDPYAHRSCGPMYSTGLGTVLSSYVDANGNCYNYQTGQRWSCFDYRSQGGLLPGGGFWDLTPGTAPAGTPAARDHAHWVMTENGQSAQVDNVHPYFTSYSLTDLWQPSDRLTINAGVRLDHLLYATDDLVSGYPARQFWFNAYDREHCSRLGQDPQWTFNPVDGGFGACANGFAPMWVNGAVNPGVGLTNVGAGNAIANVLQPRVSFTYSTDPNTVIRGSYGKYARAEASSYYQYNTYQQNLASFISQFVPYGYTSPDHNIYPDTSYNADLSLEKHLKGTEYSFKLTPFYRTTRNQVEYKAINPLVGTLAGLNIGTQRSYGVELSLQAGDFSRDGFSAQLSYTYTNSKVQFAPINGQSVIDGLNSAIEQFNSFTRGCAGVTSSSANWAACGSGLYAGNAAAKLSNVYAPQKPGTLAVPNPYYNYSLQPLMDKNGWYEPYDTIPGAFSYSNGFEVPNVVSLILNYKHKNFTVTPSLHYIDGSFYGSPLVYPGYVPQFCSQLPSKTASTPGVSCHNDGAASYNDPAQAIFIPDPYTGRFDTPGSLREPSQFTMNLQMAYDVSPRVSVTATLVNIVNVCPQRGYAWDNQITCVYGNLPSNIQPPSGNFLTNPPTQLKYPYGTFFNITETGETAPIQPFNLFVNLSVKV